MDSGEEPVVISDEKRRTNPPQRLETEEERKADELAEVPVGVTTPEERAGEADPGLRED